MLASTQNIAMNGNTLSEIDDPAQWKAFSFQPTISRAGVDEYVDALLTVSSNSTATLIALMRLIKKYEINIKSGMGARLTEFQSNTLNLSIPLGYVQPFRDELARSFDKETRTTHKPDEIKPVRKYYINYSLSLAVDHDTPGVLASVMIRLAEFNINVVAMTASTAPNNLGVPGELWGQAEAKIRVPNAVDPDDIWESMKFLQKKYDCRIRLVGLESSYDRSNYEMQPEASGN